MTHQFQALNETLYQLLRRRFGEVRVASAGEAMTSRVGYDPIEKRNYLDIIHPGEYYVVNCPYCGDSGKRLWIHHTWGTADKDLGGRRLHLAVCYNEECLSEEWERRVELLEQVTEQPGVLEKAPILTGKAVNLEDMQATWPGPVTRLDRLPQTHEACAYLRSRGFDPEILGRFYGVRYCHDSDRWLARKRIIIPVYDNKKLMGWQARHVGNDTPRASDGRKLPRYYTMPGTPRRLLLYNYANASTYRTGVLVEGPADVWGVGPMGMGSLGSKITADQLKKLIRAFRKYSCVWVPDPSVRDDPTEQKNIRNVAREMTGSLKNGFAIVWLPPGRDPGDMDRTFLREYIAQEAAKQGCRVSYKRRAKKSSRKTRSPRRRRLTAKGSTT